MEFLAGYILRWHDFSLKDLVKGEINFMRISNKRVLHVMWTNAPHLNGPISRQMASISPYGKLCMWDLFPIPKGTSEWSLNEELNQKWISSLPKHYYLGVLHRSFWEAHRNWWLKLLCHGRIGGYIYTLLNVLHPDISFVSLCMLAFGPRRILMHGRLFKPATMFWLSLMGKRVVHIHWGGYMNLEQGRLVKFAYRFAYGRCRQSFVLMKPEEKMFDFVTSGKIKTLPYASASWEGKTYDENNTRRNLDSRQILLGNNAYDFCSAGYKPILERLSMSEWDRVTAMFNYGKGHSDVDGHITRRINELQQIGGEKFHPWVTTVPFDEYLRIVNESAYYFCPAKHHSGLGAIYTSIKQGKAIFLRGENYEWLTSLGVKVYNIDEVEDFTYASLRRLIPDIETAKRNYKIIYDLCCSDASVERWLDIIEGAFD